MRQRSEAELRALLAAAHRAGRGDRVRQIHEQLAPLIGKRVRAEAMARARERRLAEPGSVYFIQAGRGGPVKIGYTAGPVSARLSELQVGNHAELRVIGLIPKGSRKLEARLHGSFRRLAIRGEWFQFDCSIAEYLREGGWALAELDS